MSVSSPKRNILTSSNDMTLNSEIKKDNVPVNSNVMNIPDTKWIQVFINGDEYFPGCRCVINNRYYRNLDMFLNYLTERLKPSFGAVRNIYTPVNGHPVHRLEDLISKHKYVVAGNERFKKLEFGYSDGTNRKLKRPGKKLKHKFKIPKVKPQCHNITLTIYCHQNGNFKTKPSKVMLLPQDLENYEQALRKICESLKCGSIKRVYRLNGKPIQTVEELVDSQTYVIVGKHEIFKPGPYELISQKNISSSKEKYFLQNSSRKASSVITNRSFSVHSQTFTQAQTLPFASNDDDNQVSQPEAPSYNTLNVTGYGNGIDSYDSYQDTNHELNTKETVKIKINLDNDMSGIFRSKNRNDLTAGAVEVEDSSETVVDLPVDLLDAEEVDDEITPDMERSLQSLSLNAPEEIIAYLPSMQNSTKSMHNLEENQVSSNKYNLNSSQTLDIHNVFV